MAGHRSPTPTLIACLLLLAVAPIAMAANAGDARPLTPIGAASIDITPDGPIRLTGYASRKEESQGVESRLFAKALVISEAAKTSGGGPAVLITVENCGVPGAITREIARRLKDAGVAPAKLVIGSSHTHTAPALPGFAPYLWGRDLPASHLAKLNAYQKQLIDKLEQVARQALKNRRPGRLRYAQGKAAFAANRRVIQDGKWSGFGVQKDGPVDHRVPVLQAVDADGKVIATLAGYACHCTTLGGDFNKVCGDWAGYAQGLIEKKHGGVGMVIIGCGADQNPEPRGKLQQAKDHGESLARAVDRVVKGPMRPIAPRIEATRVETKLPLEAPPTQAALQATAKQKGIAGYHAKKLLERLDRDGKLPTHVPYAAQSWQFGDDLAMVFLPGEVVVDYALRFRREMDPARVWISAYCNDMPCYLPSRRVLLEGGYEADRNMLYYAQPARFKPEVEDALVKAVRQAVPMRFQRTAPRSPGEFIASLDLHPGLKMDVVASEPLIVDPVAIDFGADGKLWVLEMRDYPEGMDGKFKPGGRVKFLEDEDGDGKYDKATVFLDGLPFPTGIKTWDGGVIICAAPDLIFAKDTDGDGKADHRRVLATGFGTNNYHTRVNGPTLGLDNWLHVANGMNSRQIKVNMTDEEVSIAGRDFRMNLGDGTFEPVAGMTQYGRARDDWGNWFGLDNSHLLYHYPLQDRYLRRNPFVASPNHRVYIPGGDGRAVLFPQGDVPDRTTSPLHAGRVTSACGLSIYRDTLLGNEYVGDAFVCEPAQNLITRRKLQRRGATFLAQRAATELKREFIASDDIWFRPAQTKLGPDSALWVVDMYRHVIEHTRWLPDHVKQRVDVRAGDNRGRVYRVYRQGVPLRKRPVIDSLETDKLVKALDDPNGTWRDMVHQALLRRRKFDVVPPLRELIKSTRLPAVRLQAICILQGVFGLTGTELAAALSDEDPRVVAHALRIAQTHAWPGHDPRLSETLRELKDDKHPAVRLQVAYALGHSTSDGAAEMLGGVLLRDADDPYLTAAAMSSARGKAAAILKQYARRPAKEQAAKPVPDHVTEALLMTWLGEGNDAEAAAVLHWLLRSFEGSNAFDVLATPDANALRHLATVLDHLLRRGRSMDKLAQSKDPQLKAAVTKLDSLIPQAREAMGDPTSAGDVRRGCINLLGRRSGHHAEDIAALNAMLSPDTPPTLQTAAVQRLIRLGQGRDLLKRQAIMSTGVRDAMVNALLARGRESIWLLEHAKSDAAARRLLSAAQRQRLLTSRNSAIRKLATQVLGAPTASTRAGVIDRFKSAATAAGDAALGKKLFTQYCAACHQLDGVGNAVGPDLRTLTDRSPNALMTAILDPNRAVEPKYVAYSVATEDGDVLVGILTSETSTSVTLATADGKKRTLLRRNITSLRSTGMSLMPEGLEAGFAQAKDLADLMAFVLQAK